jgi:photosystem II stability/assembly factor-like uncharacterized protein
MTTKLTAVACTVAATVLAAVAAASPAAPAEEGWTKARSAPPLGAFPVKMGWTTAFAFDPRNPNTAYASAGNSVGPTTRGHVFKTTDQGAHWRSTATTGAGWTRADALAADPHRPGTLYAGNVVAVYKTVDGGRSWQAFNKGLFTRPRRVCSRPPGAGRQLCWTWPYGTPGTTDWNRGEGWVTALAVDPANSNIVYAGADAVRKSTDGGHTWKQVFRARTKIGTHVSALAIAPTHPEAIYAIASFYSGRSTTTAIYKSTNAGGTWHATGSLGSVFTSPVGSGSALAIDPHQPTTLYAAIDGVVFTSSDAGASWQPITAGLPNNVASASIAVDPQHSGTVYAGLSTYRATNGKYHQDPSTSGIYMTTDGGTIWTQRVSGVGIDTLAVDPARPTTIYAAGSDQAHYRLLRSTDSGTSWTRTR